jgi:uncharacterized repeat protein (TIGR02543 family)
MRSLTKKLFTVFLSLALLLSPCNIGAAQAENTSIHKSSFSIGQTIYSSFSEEDEIQTHHFSLSSSGTASFTYTKTSDVAFNMRIFDSKNNAVFNSYMNSSESFSIDLIKGDYTIETECYYDPGSYTIKTGFVNANETYTGDNSTLEKANTISLGSTFIGHIAENRVEDNYKFTLPNSGKLTITYSQIDDIYAWISLYNEDKVKVWEDHVNESEALSIDLTKGTYFLKIDGSNYGGAYRLKTSFINSNETYTGDNGSLKNAHPISLGKTIYGHIAENREEDNYKFTVPSSGTVRITYTQVDDLSAYLSIYDSDNIKIWEEFANESETFKTHLPKDTYTIKVEGSYSTGAYKLKIYRSGYKITYVLNGGQNNSQNPSSYTSSVTLKNPTRKGYTFAGWYTDKNFKHKVTKLSGKSCTVYARWKKVTVAKGPTPTLTNLKGKKLKISYKKISGVKGYQIRYSTDKNFKKNVKTITTTAASKTYTLKKATYYVKIRAYKSDSTNSKVYGTFGSVRSKKITK